MTVEMNFYDNELDKDITIEVEGTVTSYDESDVGLGIVTNVEICNVYSDDLQGDELDVFVERNYKKIEEWFYDSYSSQDFDDGVAEEVDRILGK